MILRRIDPASLAKISGLGYAVMGFIFGIVVSIFSLLGPKGASTQQVSGLSKTLFGVGAVVFLPLFYGILGFVSGFIIAWVYNWLAKRIGGLKLDFES